MPGTRIGRQQTVSQRDDIESRLVTGTPGRFFKNSIARFFATVGAPSTGAQVTFELAFSTNIQAVQLLRNVSKDPGAAQLLQTWNGRPLLKGNSLVGRPLTYHDADPATFAATVFYFLKLIPGTNNFEPLLSGPLEVAVP